MCLVTFTSYLLFVMCMVNYEFITYCFSMLVEFFQSTNQIKKKKNFTVIICASHKIGQNCLLFVYLPSHFGVYESLGIFKKSLPGLTDMCFNEHTSVHFDVEY